MPKTTVTQKCLPRVCRRGPGGRLTIAVARYRRRLQARLDEYLALMEAHWGFRPDIRVSLATDIVGRADFNLKGFAHEGQRTHVKAEHAEGRHRPERVARAIAAELVVHRATCERCGVGVPSLWQRAHFRPDRPGGHPVWYTDADGRQGYRPARPEDLAAFDRPADPVERAVLPGLARRLDRRLRAQAEAEAEARAKEPEYETASVEGSIRNGDGIALKRRSDNQPRTGVVKDLRVEGGRLVAEVEVVEDDCAIRRPVVLAGWRLLPVRPSTEERHP